MLNIKTKNKNFIWENKRINILNFKLYNLPIKHHKQILNKMGGLNNNEMICAKLNSSLNNSSIILKQTQHK